MHRSKDAGRLTIAIAATFVALLGAAPNAWAQADAPVRYESDFLTADFHEGRRAALRAALPDDAIAIVFSAPERTRSNDVKFEYRPSSDLLYLTGSHEPGTALLLAPGGIDVDGSRVTEVLFVPPRDPNQEVWLGRRYGASRAMERLGVELALERTRFDEIVEPLLAAGEHRLYHLPLPEAVARNSVLGLQLATVLRHVEPLVITQAGLEGFVLHGMLTAESAESYQQVWRTARMGGFDPSTVPHPVLRAAARAFVDSGSLEAWAGRRAELLAPYPDGTTLRTTLDRLRAIKADEELALLQRAIDITAAAHVAVMEEVQPGWAEYEIEALIEYTFKREGAEYPGFPSIVGSGENSVILHYETNRRTTEPGDLVVIDIGAEYHGYSADITRTVPVDGTFTPEQRAIYELVYEAQQEAIDVVRAGSSFGAPHAVASRVLAAGLAELGLIVDPSDRQGLGRFFMHGTSHYLGLDVHDVGPGGPLEPGTVITVEPGLYIPESADIDPKWWNIGVRIEDDVLVTEGDPVVLSAAVPSRRTRVEAAMRRPAS